MNARYLSGVVALPILLKIHLILGIFQASPVYFFSGLGQGAHLAPTPPYSSIDFNVGAVSQALGHRAALDLLSGVMPWWNPYEGVGTPLAGEMQSAALLPLSVLLALPDGQLYMQLLFQIIAGIFTYLLLRRMGVSGFAAFIAAILFEFNGAYGWLANAVINPIAFLPMILFGIEGCYAAIDGAWRWIALGIALSLYAGFPEVAYIDGLLVAIWSLARAAVQPLSELKRAISHLGLGVLTSLLLAMPILIAFFDYLPNATVVMHQRGFFSYMHLSPSIAINLFLPYIFGLISNARLAAIQFPLWGNAGGYFGIGILALALFSLFGRKNRTLRLVLAGWVIVSLTTAFGGPFGKLLFLIPGLSNTDFARYFNASCAMALAVLAALALDDLDRSERPDWRYWSALAGTLLLIACSVRTAGILLNHVTESSIWFRNSVLMAAMILGVFIWAGISHWPLPGKRVVLGLVVAVEAMVNFTIPTFSNPDHTALALGGVRFLQEHLDLQRFYSIRMIEPNYGSYFGIAQVDDCDLPIPVKWLGFRNHHLDPGADPLMFDGNARTASPALPTAIAAVKQNLPQYLAVGVKYIVTRSGPNPFVNDPPGKSPTILKVYGDSVMSIYQLDHPRPYFDAPSCRVFATTRNEVIVNCPTPATLTRLELFMPGWHADISGKAQPIYETSEIFQSLRLPAGQSVVRFHFRPPFMTIGYLALLFGLILLSARIGSTSFSEEKEAKRLL